MIHDLKLCLAKNKAEMSKIQKQLKPSTITPEQLKSEISKLLPMFTPNQLSLMTKEKKRVNWTTDEIADGFAHSYLGTRSYKYSIQKKKIPEPSIRTLQKWGEKMRVAPGILDCSFVVLKALRDTLTEGESQYVLYGRFQNNIGDEMYETISTMKCYNKNKDLQNSLQIFQKGILMSITSVKALRTKMNQKFKFNYVITHRLNQDCLEIFYSQMRFRNGANDHPTPLECLYNMKTIMLGKNHTLTASMHCNTIDREPDEYVSAMFHKMLSTANPIDDGNGNAEEYLEEYLDEYSDDAANSSYDIPEEFLEDVLVDVTVPANDSDDKNEENVRERVVGLIIEFINEDAEANVVEDHTNEVTTEFINDLWSEMNVDEAKSLTRTLTEDGLEYLAGWISLKFKDSSPHYSTSRRQNLPSYVTDHSYAKSEIKSDSWVDTISYGGLSKPTKQVFDWVKQLEEEFLRAHGEGFISRTNVKRDLIELMKENCKEVPHEIINLFARSRIYMRCKHLNKKRVEEALLKKKERRERNVLKRKAVQCDDSSRAKVKKMNKIIL